METLLSLNKSDKIELISIVLTFCFSLITVWIAIRSLRVTQKSIEDANKPYIACFLSSVDVGFSNKYLVIKNFGKTPAVITDLKLNRTVRGLGMDGNINSIINTTIAPNQKFITNIDDDERDLFSIEITYKDLNNVITIAKFDLNPLFASDLVYVTRKHSELSVDSNAMMNALHSLTKNNL